MGPIQHQRWLLAALLLSALFSVTASSSCSAQIGDRMFDLSLMAQEYACFQTLFACRASLNCCISFLLLFHLVCSFVLLSFSLVSMQWSDEFYDYWVNLCHPLMAPAHYTGCSAGNESQVVQLVKTSGQCRVFWFVCDYGAAHLEIWYATVSIGGPIDLFISVPHSLNPLPLHAL